MNVDTKIAVKKLIKAWLYSMSFNFLQILEGCTGFFSLGICDVNFTMPYAAWYMKREAYLTKKERNENRNN